MPRIPQEEINRVKGEVSVEKLVRASGIELRAHGDNLVGRCIWHQDDTPSLIVTPSKNLWHCMGACQTGGDVFAWVMKAEKKSFVEAYARLIEECGPAPQLEVVSPVSATMTDEELLHAVLSYYAGRAKERSEFGAFLKRRGIDDAAMIEHFRIGYAPADPSLKLPALSVREGRELRARMERLGIFRAPRGHEHFAGSMVVPIFDERGYVAEIYGRKVRDDLRGGTLFHVYRPGPHRGVWNLEALRETKEIILCEAAIDAMTFYRHGFHNVTWSYGVEGFTRDHLAAFKAYGTERVLIAYDRDDAGDRAALKLAAKLVAEGITCYRIEFPKGMDANECALKMTPATKTLALLIKSASLIGKPGATIVVPPDPIKEEEKIEKPASSLAAPSVDVTPPPPMPQASPVVEAPREIDLELRSENEILVTFGDRVYRIRGIKKNTSFEVLRINVLLTRTSTNAVYLDTFDLSMARQRAMFERQAAVEIGVKEDVIHREMGQILCALERIRDEEIERAQKPKAATPQMTAEERAAALDHLMKPDLIARTVDHLTRCGLVGETTNKLMAYIAATSRKLEKPLALIIQSSSAAGKTTLMETVLGCMPPEEVVRYSAITGKALFYISDPSALKNKILAISEEQGAEQATYALKLLQSEGKLSIASTGKDPHTGRLESQVYHVEGPIMPVMTTTAPEVDDELQNRCIVLTADEDREQTRAIHQRQREAQTIDKLLATHEADDIYRLQQNTQRLVQPILVANPYAEHLTFLDAKTRTRRDHMKYLTLIRTIALLHQYQRPHKTRVLASGERVEYIEVELSDIALANDLAHEVLGRSLDELAPQTRKLVGFIAAMVHAACERQRLEQNEYFFTQRDVREATGWPDHQVKLHLRKLVEMEYVLLHRGGRGQSFVYELLYRGEGDAGKPFLMGLIDVGALRNVAIDENRDSRNGKWDSRKDDRDISGTARGDAGERGGTAKQIARKASADAALLDAPRKPEEKTLSASEPREVDQSRMLALPKPEKKVRRYLLRGRGGNGRVASFTPRRPTTPASKR